MTAPAQTRSARDLSLGLLELINKSDWDKLDEIYDADVITEWPQTGERVRGIENARRIFASYPGGADTPVEDIRFVEGDEGRYVLTPMFTVVKTEGMGDTATSTVKTRYPDGSDWYVITIAKARNGKVVHATQYFAPVLKAPEWRAAWVEAISEQR